MSNRLLFHICLKVMQFQGVQYLIIRFHLKLTHHRHNSNMQVCDIVKADTNSKCLICVGQVSCKCRCLTCTRHRYGTHFEVSALHSVLSLNINYTSIGENSSSVQKWRACLYYHCSNNLLLQSG